MVFHKATRLSEEKTAAAGDIDAGALVQGDDTAAGAGTPAAGLTGGSGFLHGLTCAAKSCTIEVSNKGGRTP